MKQQTVLTEISLHFAQIIFLRSVQQWAEAKNLTCWLPCPVILPLLLYKLSLLMLLLAAFGLYSVCSGEAVM